MKRSFLFFCSSLLVYGCAGSPSGGFDEVVIDSTPPGAVVIVNGIERGRTPLGLTLAANQNHTLVFRHGDYPDKSLELHRHLVATSVSIQVLFASLAPRARIGSDIAPGEDLTVVYGGVEDPQAPFSRRHAPLPPAESPAPAAEPETDIQEESTVPQGQETGMEESVVEESAPEPPQVERCTRCRRDAVAGSKYCEVHGD